MISSSIFGHSQKLPLLSKKIDDFHPVVLMQFQKEAFMASEHVQTIDLTNFFQEGFSFWQTLMVIIRRYVTLSIRYQNLMRS
nr:hypothetical protein [Escherichia coli]